MQTQEHSETDLNSMLESVIDRNSQKWLRFILRILKNEADAEDVFQEAVRRVLSHNRLLPSEDDARMYLSRAIGNAALELYNCRKRERTKYLPIHEYNLLQSMESSPYKCMEEMENCNQRQRMLNLLNDGLLRLPAKEQEALRLTVLETHGLSIRDAGMSNGIPYSTLRHRSKQALHRLRRFIKRSLKDKKLEAGSRKPE
jgi:RNA polymerase sigma factor (sigma-70 family)